MIYSAEQPPAHFNMAQFVIGRAAEATPDKPGLLVIADAVAPRPDEVWSYRQLEQAVLSAAAALLAEGLKPGDRVLIRLDNTSAYALLFFAAIAAGLVPIPASSQLTAREADFLLADSGASAIAAAAQLALGDVPPGVRILSEAWVARALQGTATAAGYAATNANDPAYLVYTSGTTSNPKGVLHAQRAAWGRRPMVEGWYGLTPNDRVLHAGAFNWTYTLGTGLTDPWANGATAMVFTGDKDPAVWPALIREHRATIFAAVPTLYRQILKYTEISPRDLAHFRHGLTAGEALPETLRQEWRARTGTMLYEALGMSELSTFLSSSPAVPPKPGTVGRPQAGRSVAILAVDGGEQPLPAGAIGLLAAHRTDPGLMLGYWQRPEEEREAFRGDWFIGGDLCSMDTEGYVTHHGRANDLMNAMGYRVSPMEVEHVIAGHPWVAEVAAAEVQVRQGVSIIAAFIVLKEGVSPDTASRQSVSDFAGERLAAYKQPREIVYVKSLPRTPNGKIKRAELRQNYARDRSS